MTATGRVVVKPPGTGRSFRIGADRFERKGTVGRGMASYSVVEYTGAPHAPGPPLHLHRAFEETFFLIEGELEFTARHRALHLGPGAYLHVPRGVPHTFRVAGDSPARWIGIFSPGRYVGLIERLGPLIPANGPPDIRKVAALFARYDTELV